MTDDLRPRIPTALLARYDKSTSAMTPTLHKVRFGSTDTLAKITSEAQRLAKLADAAAETWRAVHSTHWASMADGTATEGSRLVRSAQFARKRLDAINAEYDAAMDAAEARLTAIKGKLDTAARPPASMGEAAIDAEARALIRAATDPAKALALAKAHPRAVATASPEVAGVTREVHASIRTAYLETVAPEDASAYSDLLAAVQSAGAARKELDSSARELIDFGSAERIAGMQWNQAA